MRFQQKINNQSCGMARNRDLLNVNMSSDFCIFSSPTFDLSGTTKIIIDEGVCEFSGISFSNILTAATADCVGLTGNCIDTIDWTTKVYEDGDVVYSGSFASTTSTGTPTTNQFLIEVAIGLNTLGYVFDVLDTELTIEKPFGASNVQIDICTDIVPLVTTACTFTGSCVQYCESACTQSYDTLTSASTGVYVIDSVDSGITVTFNFTGNTDSFSADTIFKYEIYKYNHSQQVFAEPAIFKSDNIPYSSFSGTSAITETILISDLSIDGDYLVKGYFVHNVCTDILKRLDLTNDTSTFKTGSLYSIYEPEFDYYFVAVAMAEEPILSSTLQATQRPLGSLVAFSILPDDGETDFTISTNVEGDLLIYLNGLLLANDLDYVLSGDSLTLSGATILGDVLTYVSVANALSNGLVVENISISDVIISGGTDGEGTNLTYFNTTEGKFEIYTLLTPFSGNDIVVTLNGVTLAPNIDYYQSITNPKRIILEGDLLVGDIINIVYNAFPAYVGDIFTNTPTIFWNIPAPELANGIFTVQVATDDTFTTIISTGTANYVGNQSSYSTEVTVSGTVGTDYVYRVCNEKNYVTLIGDTVTTTTYSEEVPITILSNLINSY